MTSSNLKRLPLPNIKQTAEKQLKVWRQILDKETYQQAVKDFDDFLESDASLTQAELAKFADKQRAMGENWMSRHWLGSYLSVTEPLPLSTNVGFEIAWAKLNSGLERAVDFTHSFLSVHLDYLNGDIKPDVTPRDQAIDMRQWRVLAGGLRHPEREIDEIITGPTETTERTIGVFWQNRLFEVTVTDVNAMMISKNSLRKTFDKIIHHSADGSDFAGMSYLGSDSLNKTLKQLLTVQENRLIYRRLKRMIFTVTLTDDEKPVENHLEKLCFGPSQAWVYKPLNYSISLRDDFVGVHVEHSMIDGATLSSVIRQAQTVKNHQTIDTKPILNELRWKLTDKLDSLIKDELETYKQSAINYKVKIVRTPNPVPINLPYKVSHDGIMQLIMLYAQLATYGKVRGTYEAADMREYQAGRTEALRPNTNEAVAFVSSLLDDRADKNQLLAALAAHKAWVISCKTGQAVDRHMMMLGQMAKLRGDLPALFDGRYSKLTQDFLSTTSVGSHDQIVRFVFAPTTSEGIGINYTPSKDSYEFCLSYNETSVDGDIQKFAHNLVEGCQKISQLLTLEFN